MVIGLALTSLLMPSLRAHAATRPFASSSPFNLPIVTAPALDPSSAAMVSRFSRSNQANANLVAYGVPIYTADPGAATVTVTCTYSWGQCPFDQVPIPAGATPNTGSDGVLVVLQGDLAYELWQAKSGNSSWTASWGAVNNISSVDGWGWGGSGTGSGASRAAGVVRVAEIEAGVIDHALVVQTDTVCADVVRTPALKTDGDSRRSDCIPEGARIQLDPSIDLD
ncbi:MAG: hypothetical protein QM650_06140, partial [Microlunatus sp.]